MTRYQHSKQWRGERFVNPEHWPARTGLRDVLRWQLSGRPPRDHSFVPPMVPNDGTRLRENSKLPTVTWIGHATLLVQIDGLSILTDPMFAPRMFTIKRLAPPGVALSDLPPIDAVVVSHNHAVVARRRKTSLFPSEGGGEVCSKWGDSPAPVRLRIRTSRGWEKSQVPSSTLYS